MKNNKIRNICLSKSTVPRENGLISVVNLLSTNRCGLNSFYGRKKREITLPSRNIIIEIVEELRSVLFPGYHGISELNTESIRFHIGATLDRLKQILQEQIKLGLCFSCDDKKVQDCSRCVKKADIITQSFINKLPWIKKMLVKDVQAAYEDDPAATSPDETIFCYPGILAITNYRIAHEFYMLGVPLIPRIITEHAHSITGIDIHPGATIGESFFIDHGTGVVIGETSIIGKRVRIYQGVTLGAKSFQLDTKGKPIKGIKRHPIVEDDVIIYSGATIIGRVVIGKESVIGGNVWLTHSVPQGSHVKQTESRQETFDRGEGI